MKFAMKWLALLALLLAPVAALAGDNLLLVEMPESAVLVENVSFEDGDFVQSYQLEGGVMLMLVRYGGMSMTADELVESEWAGSKSVTPGTIEEIDGYPAQHVIVRADDGFGGEIDANLIVVSTDDATLILQITGPAGTDVTPILGTLHVQSGDEVVTDTAEAEVG